MRALLRRRVGLAPLKIKTGFTLVELMLVVLILLVIIGLSTPLFRKTFSDLAAKDTSFNISKLINYAQEIAILQRKVFKITFDFQNGKYQLFEVDVSAKPPGYKKIQGRLGKRFGVPQGVVLSGNKKEAAFYPDGHCDELKVNVLVKKKGYSLTVRRFGNMVELENADIE